MNTFVKNNSLLITNKITWTPPELPILSLWLDPNDTDTLTLDTDIYGNAVATQWRDKSTSSHILNKPYPTADLQAPLISSINGLTALRTSDLVHRLLATSTPVLTSQTFDVYAILQRVSSEQVSNGVFYQYNTFNSSRTIFYQGSATYSLRLQIGNFITAPGSDDMNPHLYGWQKSNINLTLLRDGNSLLSTSFTGTPQNAPFQIGGLYSNPDIKSASYYGEVIVVNNANLNTNDRQRVEGYLAHKWGLTANLPNEHPYKSSPPT